MPRLCALTVLCATLSGCSGSAKAPVDTGARQCVIGFSEALIRRDWQAAHGLLHRESQKRFNQQRLADSATAYLRDMGFQPEVVVLGVCEEKDGEATGHVVFTGRVANKSRRYRDAILVKKTDDSWGVMLPSSWAAD